MDCFTFSVQFGLLAGGGLGNALVLPSYDEDNFDVYWVRYIMDVSFVSIITILFLTLLFGIIIDSFAALRDKRNDLLKDMNSICKFLLIEKGFICGINRKEFDKNADGFKVHIDRDH